MALIGFDQLNLSTSDFEGLGVGGRELNIKSGAISEDKLGFSFVTLDLTSADFTFDGTRSNYTLAQSASSSGAVSAFGFLSENGVGD